MNEITITAEPMTGAREEMLAVRSAYDAETCVDQTIPIRKRLEALSIIVTPENIEQAKKNRTALNALLKDAAAPRLRVQRAFKATEVGRFASTKSELEKEIEAKSDHLKLEIEAHSRAAETLALATEKKDWVLIVKNVDLATMNKLVGYLTDKQILAENRGPFVEEVR